MWARVTALHFLLMFWWVWLAAAVLTACGEALWAGRIHRRLLASGPEGWRPLGLALLLGILSPPSRRRIFGEARALLAGGASPRTTLAYLIGAQSLLVWFLLAVLALNGPQLVIGQLVAVGAALVFLLRGTDRIPAPSWERAREAARAETSGSDTPITRAGPIGLRLAKSLADQVLSLWWPILYGLAGVGFFLALGQSDAYVSLQGSKGPLVQAANALVGLLVAFVSGAPLVGNALFGAGLWKPEFVTYTGLSAFYLGTLVMPFVLPRWFAVLGVELTRRLIPWIVAAIVVGALVAAGWWWGLDGLAGLLGVREWFEGVTHSTLRPNDVPWFHHWFAPGI